MFGLLVIRPRRLAAKDPVAVGTGVRFWWYLCARTLSIRSGSGGVGSDGVDCMGMFGPYVALQRPILGKTLVAVGAHKGCGGTPCLLVVVNVAVGTARTIFLSSYRRRRQTWWTPSKRMWGNRGGEGCRRGDPVLVSIIQRQGQQAKGFTRVRGSSTGKGLAGLVAA